MIIWTDDYRVWKDERELNLGNLEKSAHRKNIEKEKGEPTLTFKEILR